MLKRLGKGWRRISRKWQSSTNAMLNLKRDFECLNMQKDETISKYSNLISLNINNIILLGEDFSYCRIVKKVLCNYFWKVWVQNFLFEELKDLSKIWLGELISSLQAQEQRRTIRQDKLTECVFHVHKQQVGKGKKQFNQRSKGINEGGNNNKGSKLKKNPSLHTLQEDHTFWNILLVEAWCNL